MTREDARGMCELIKNCLCTGNPIWNTEVIAEAMDMVIDALSDVPDTNVGKWMPFTDREATEEDDFPKGWRLLDCKLPENGQRILVTIRTARREFVQADEYYDDDGCYLDSGFDLVTEAVAWMPLPEPYKEEQK